VDEKLLERAVRVKLRKLVVGYVLPFLLALAPAALAPAVFNFAFLWLAARSWAALAAVIFLLAVTAATGIAAGTLLDEKLAETRWAHLIPLLAAAALAVALAPRFFEIQGSWSFMRGVS